MKNYTLNLFAILLIAFPTYSQTVTTFTGGTPDDAIAIDSNGNIYCSNYVGDTVFKFTPSGDVSSFITGLNTPNGLAFNSNQELYVCDGVGNTIYRYDSNGDIVESYPVTGHPSGIIKSPNNDTMIFTLYQGNRINTLSPDGTIIELSSALELSGPVGLAIDDNDDLYVGNYNNREIYRVLQNGDLEFVAEVPTDGGQMPNLGFIAYGQGHLWGTTMGSDKIFKINPNGVNDYDLFAGSSQGSTDGDISQATFHTPNGILFNDSEDTMYITDFGTKNLRIISNIALGVNENIELEKSMMLYPNPAHESVRISTHFSDDLEYRLQIIDMSGKVVFSHSGLSDQQLFSKEIDVNALQNGIYLVSLRSGSDQVLKKMIKQ